MLGSCLPKAGDRLGTAGLAAAPLGLGAWRFVKFWGACNDTERALQQSMRSKSGNVQQMSDKSKGLRVERLDVRRLLPAATSER